MLKAGIKRRRTQQQIKDQKQEESLRAQAVEEKLAKFEQLMEEFKVAKQEANAGKHAASILSNMIENG